MSEPTKKVDYYKNGNISYKEYYLNNKLHRVDGPAHISYNENGSISYEEYYLNDKLHRVDGPAYISYYEDGNIRCEEYWLNSKEFTKEEFLVSKEYQNYLADLEIERMLGKREG